MNDWDRSKQTYWISRQDRWIVISMKTGLPVCDYPTGVLSTRMTEVCFAKDDEEVKAIANEIKDENPRNKDIMLAMELMNERRKNRQ